MMNEEDRKQEYNWCSIPKFLLRRLCNLTYFVGVVGTGVLVSAFLLLPVMNGIPLSFDNVQRVSEGVMESFYGEVMFKSKVNSTSVSGLARELKRGCGDKVYCKINNFSSFVSNNITYTMNYTDVPSSETVVERGEGRCVGKAILFASLLQTINGENHSGFEVQPYLVQQPNHLCVYYQYKGNITYQPTGEYWNCFNEEIEYMTKIPDTS